MLILLAIPVIVAIAFAQRLIQAVAPSNMLVRIVRSARPRWLMAVGLLGLTAVLLTTMQAIASAISAGAPGWLNFLVLVLAWDAMKVGWLSASVFLRSAVGAVRQFVGRMTQLPEATS